LCVGPKILSMKGVGPLVYWGLLLICHDLVLDAKGFPKPWVLGARGFEKKYVKKKTTSKRELLEENRF